MSGIAARLVLFCIAGASWISQAEADVTANARQKHFSMEVRSTGSQSIRRHSVSRDDALLRRASDPDAPDALVQDSGERDEAEKENEERGATEHEDLQENEMQEDNGMRIHEEEEDRRAAEGDDDDNKDDDRRDTAGDHEKYRTNGDEADASNGAEEEGGSDGQNLADDPPSVRIEAKTITQDDMKESDEVQAGEDQEDVDHAGQVGVTDPGEDSSEAYAAAASQDNDSSADGGDSGSGGLIIASREKRRKCPMWQNMGCLLDVMEKACEPDEGSPQGLIEKTATESAWMCCCPNPYQPCEKSERVKSCDKAMNAHVVQLMGRDVKSQTLLTALQKVRGALRSAGGSKCKVLAPSKPVSTCGYANKPKVTRSIGRADLFCEMLSWQMEELGDGNAAEFGQNKCPYNEAHRAAQSMERKGHNLSDEQIQ